MFQELQNAPQYTSVSSILKCYNRKPIINENIVNLVNYMLVIDQHKRSTILELYNVSQKIDVYTLNKDAVMSTQLI